MSPKKFDGVVEAVRYSDDGSIKTVRVYERRGSTFTDRILLDRAEFLERLKGGKRFLTGHRIPYLASEFNVSTPVQLKKVDGREVIVAGDEKSGRDTLEGVPLF